MKPGLILSLLALVASASAQAPPSVCDLDVLYIQRTPRYPGYLPQYDLPGKEGQPTLVRWTEKGERIPLTPAEIAGQQRWPREGDTVTYTAVVENKGAVDAPPFEYTWSEDGGEANTGKTDRPLKPGERIELAFTHTWTDDPIEIELWVDPMRRVRQSSYYNDRRSRWTHAKLLICYVDRVTYDSFAKNRNVVGTFSFEDWCQEHADWMNLLFERSIYADTAPDGISERIAVDFIGVLDDEEAHEARWRDSAPLKEGWDGGWWFGRNPNCADWAAGMDWGLIHEWGHQLGLTDLYALDVAPENNLVLDPAGSPLLIGRHSAFEGTMMHGHGPVLFSEDQAIALNHQLWRRRGYYGDYYYNLAERNFVRVRDTADDPVAGAQLRFWQRGPDGIFEGEPTLVGTTDADGRFLLPNRPAPDLITYGDEDGGYHLRPNPFGLINVVGGNGVVLVEIRARGQTDYAFLEIPQFNVAKEYQGEEEATVGIATTLPVPGAPPAPPAPRAQVDGNQVTLTLDGASNWTVMRADPPFYAWKKVGAANGKSFADRLPGSGLYRYAATTETAGKTSARSTPIGVAAMVEPWGLALAADGTAYVRDRANGQTLVIRPDGSAVGSVGSVHWHFEGSYDHATDAKELLYVAKWPDGYDPKRSWIRRIDPRGKGREHDRADLAGGEFAAAPDAAPPPGRFKEPMGIWVSATDGKIVVADTGNNRVQVLNADGQLSTPGVATGLNKPHKALLAGDKLVVCDTGAKRVVVFGSTPDAPDGAAPAWKEVAVLDGFDEPIYACLGSGDDIWIADRGLGRVFATSPKTWKRLDWTFPPKDQPKLDELRGIAYDARHGDLVYLDGKAKRLVRRHVQD